MIRPLNPHVYASWLKRMPFTVNTCGSESSGVRAMPLDPMPAASSVSTVASMPFIPRSRVWFDAVEQRSKPDFASAGAISRGMP